MRNPLNDIKAILEYEFPKLSDRWHFILTVLIYLIFTAMSWIFTAICIVIGFKLAMKLWWWF